jgi:hypothetical protein
VVSIRVEVLCDLDGDSRRTFFTAHAVETARDIAQFQKASRRSTELCA